MPGTILPSGNGKRYDQSLYNVLSKFFNKLGWKSVEMITQPNEKYQVYSYPAWNIKDQKRAGPVRAYLPDAQKSENFELSLGTKVLRVVRSGSQVTGRGADCFWQVS
jgi:cellobiose dehydrogenase (acceptor)